MLELTSRIRRFTISLYFTYYVCLLCAFYANAANNKIEANYTIDYKWKKHTDDLFASLRIVKSFNWVHDMDENVVLKHEITLAEAYYGLYLYIRICVFI